MKLPRPNDRYDAMDESITRAAIERADDENLKRGRDIEVYPARVILRAPNGSRWAITVSNTGALSTVAV